MWGKWKLSLIPLATLVVVCTLHPDRLGAQSAQALPSRIGTSDQSSVVALPGNRHPLANLANDRGRVVSNVAMQRMLLVLKRDPALEAELRQLIADQQDSSSPRSISHAANCITQTLPIHRFLPRLRLSSLASAHCTILKSCLRCCRSARPAGSAIQARGSRISRSTLLRARRISLRPATWPEFTISRPYSRPE